LRGGEPGIPRLRHGGAEDIEAADVLASASYSTELFVKPLGLLPCQLGDRADAE
jgi:hypothetical protein